MYPLATALHNNLKFGMIADHLIPFVLLLIEFPFNRIRFSLKHIIIAATIMIAYGFVNLIYTAASGRTIYTGIDWKSLESFLATIVIFGASLSVYVGVYYLSKIKNDKYDAMDD